MSPCIATAPLCLALSLLTPNASAEAPEDTDWPLADRLQERFAKGRYESVATEGSALLAEEPENDGLRQAVADSLLWTGKPWAATPHYRLLLAKGTASASSGLNLANALAWTGRYSEAITRYEALVDGPLAKESRLGLANALRWQGRPDLALPHYRQLLAQASDNPEARSGALLAERAVRPRTQFAATLTKDNAPTHQKEGSIAHTWRNGAGNQIYTLAIDAGRINSPAIAEQTRDVNLSVEALDLPLAPRLELARQTRPAADTFALLRLRLSDLPFYVQGGRMNWGRAAFNAQALADGLTANQLGLAATLPTALGMISGTANHYAISDGNRLDNGDLRVVPWIRPWGQALRPYGGVNWRSAEHTDPRYWSPERYVAGYLGLEGELDRGDWSLLGFVQGSFHLAGEATTSWSGGAQGKRWLNRDWAVALAANSQSNARSGSYRANSLQLTLERLW